MTAAAKWLGFSSTSASLAAASGLLVLTIEPDALLPVAGLAETAVRVELVSPAAAATKRKKKPKPPADKAVTPGGKSASTPATTAPADANPDPAANPARAVQTPAGGEAQSSDGKPATAQSAQEPAPTQPAAEVVPPPQWTDTEIAAAMKTCARLLAPIVAEVDTPTVPREGQCGTPGVVTLKSIGSDPRIELKPGAMLNCPMVVALATWMSTTVQPAARELLGSPVVRMSGTSGYVCRNRYGRADGRMSEHAFANAIDITAFVLADGRLIDLLKHWGPTARDVTETTAQATANRPTPAEGASPPAAGPATAKPAPSARSNEGTRSRQEAPMALGRGQPIVVPVVAKPPEVGVEGRFLRRLHEGACRVFGTVLGPEANEAHRNHFHLDLAARRRGAFCE